MQPTVQHQPNYHDPEPQTSSETLWGAKARSFTGSLQVVFGVLEVILGIVVYVLPQNSYLLSDYLGWGLWCGAFSILAGCFGIASRRSKCMVITYMVLSIIAAVINACCIFQPIGSAMTVKNMERNPYNYRDGVVEDGTSRFIIYVTLAVIMILQGVASTIGASFTCGALCPTQAASGQQVICVPNGTQQKVGFSPQPNTVMIAEQPPPYFSNPTLQPPMADMTKYPS